MLPNVLDWVHVRALSRVINHPDPVTLRPIFELLACMDAGVVLLKEVLWPVKWKQNLLQCPNIAIRAIAVALKKRVSLHNNQIRAPLLPIIPHTLK